MRKKKEQIHNILDFAVESLRIKLKRAVLSGDYRQAQELTLIIDGITVERINEHLQNEGANNGGAVPQVTLRRVRYP